jgi:hypothetical protein
MRSAKPSAHLAVPQINIVSKGGRLAADRASMRGVVDWSDVRDDRWFHGLEFR